jgi:hypothetical protein
MEALPEETLLHALRSCERADLLALRGLCRRLRRVASDRSLWRRHAVLLRTAAEALALPPFALGCACPCPAWEARTVATAAVLESEALIASRCARIIVQWRADLSPFAHCRHVTVDYYLHAALDLSPLAACHTVRLGSVPTDVSPLSGCHAVALKCPGRETDLSPLARCHTIDISEAGSWTDTSSLGSCHTLRLHASGLGEPMPLRGAGYACHTVELKDVRVDDAAALAACHSVILRRCSALGNLTALSTCHTLVLSCCGVAVSAAYARHARGVLATCHKVHAE